MAILIAFFGLSCSPCQARGQVPHDNDKSQLNRRASRDQNLFTRPFFICGGHLDAIVDVAEILSAFGIMP